MAKKSKGQVPNPNSVANRDIIQRLNFLYQASVLLNSISDPSGSTSVPPRNEQRAGQNGLKKQRSRHGVLEYLPRTYIQTMKIVGQKTMVKMDPAVKRTLCRGCNIVLVPGSTATVRVKKSSSHGHAVTYTCITCKTSRRIPAPPTLNSDADFRTHPMESVHPPHLSDDARREDATVEDPSQTHISRQQLIEAPMSNRRKRKKPPTPHPPPHFARNAGHVIFRGNEKLDDGDNHAP